MNPSTQQRVLTTYKYGFDDATTGNQHGDLTVIEYANDPAATPNVSYNYDRRGRRSQTISGGMTTTHNYNDADLSTGESYSGGILAGMSVGIGHNNHLKRESVSSTAASTISQSYAYDAAGRLYTVTRGAYSVWYDYHPNSRLVWKTTGKYNNLETMRTERQYDTMNRLRDIRTFHGSAAQIPTGGAYAYNRANQRTRQDLADGSYWRYEYDALGQVMSGKKFWQDGTPACPVR